MARNFHGIGQIKKIIVAMATYKMNKLHLHLSDDEGWRLEIPGLPELTHVSTGQYLIAEDHFVGNILEGVLCFKSSPVVNATEIHPEKINLPCNPGLLNVVINIYFSIEILQNNGSKLLKQTFILYQLVCSGTRNIIPGSLAKFSFPGQPRKFREVGCSVSVVLMLVYRT